MRNQYDDKYNSMTYYWGERPSLICFEILKLMPPNRKLTLLDIGCGEGRNAVFFTRNGYNVTAFDSSEKAPDGDATAHKFVSGEIFTHYQDWKIDYCIEEIFDCQSGGIPHKHAVNRMIARKYSPQQKIKLIQLSTIRIKYAN